MARSGAVMMKLPRWLEAALSLDGTLDTKERKKRELFFAMNLAALLFLVSFSPESFQHSGVRMWLVVLAMVTCVIALVLILFKFPLRTLLVISIAYSYAVSVLLSDLISRGRAETFWSPLVLVVDLLLVMQVPIRYTLGLVVFVLAWLALMCVEEYFRFGLLDLPGLVPQEGELGRKQFFRNLSDCATPPCSSDTTSLNLGAACVFLIDFIATRGFARSILEEQSTMERTISTVQEIASLLAGYDVEGVAEMLKVHEAALPEGMRDALQSIEENLRKYKAYLPQTCLPFDKDEEWEESMTSLGATTVSSQGSRTNLMTIRAQPLGLSSTRATLLTLNIKDTLHLVEEDSTSFSDLFTTLLLKTLQATEVRRGMVDVFVGDRIHCSFNTSKICASHATSALHAATLLLCGDDDTAPHVNMGVATGKVLRGDMGCEVIRRFSMVGTLVRDVHLIERAGRVLGCSVLCNRLCFSEGECEHELRLIPCKIELAAGCDAEVVAEVVVPKGARFTSTLNEWMYVVGGKKDWEDYNTAVRSFMRGECSAEDVAAAERHGPAHTPVNVSASSGGCDVLKLYVQKRYSTKKAFVCADNLVG